MKREERAVMRTVGNLAVTVAALGCTTVICVLLHGLGETNTYVPLLFVLCVLVVSRFTDGYLYGIAASVISVLGVNYVFTYPYMALNFTISGYPLTFAVMLTAAVSTSALTTRIKHVEKLKLDAERDKLRANLLRSVSHDLRTPLTTISGSVNAVLDNASMPPEMQRELLEGVREDAAWLIRMVENLLSITRIGGEAKIDKEPEAVEEVAAEVAAKFRKRFPGVQLEISVPDEVLFVPMDAVLIEQVLANILENAVIHGEKTSHISLTVESRGQQAVFTVADNGCGISKSAMARLFEDYVEASSRSSVGEKRNMGIGLSVCMTIIKAHGGNMTAANLPEGGAEFSFWIPRDQI